MCRLPPLVILLLLSLLVLLEFHPFHFLTCFLIIISLLITFSHLLFYSLKSSPLKSFSHFLSCPLNISPLTTFTCTAEHTVVVLSCVCHTAVSAQRTRASAAHTRPSARRCTETVKWPFPPFGGRGRQSNNVENGDNMECMENRTMLRIGQWG